MDKVVKPAGQTAYSSRRRTMHGTSAEHRLGVLAGQDVKDTEKPGSRLGRQNNNQRSRGPSRPGR